MKKVASFEDVVSAAKDRLSHHGAMLEKNELATRYALIDPLLQVLGWDVHNPDNVKPEDINDRGSDRSKPDYAMYKNEGDQRPAVVLEAKKLNTEYDDSHITRYSTRAPLIIWSNGDLWKLCFISMGEALCCWEVRLSADTWSDIESHLRTISLANISSLTSPRLKKLARNFQQRSYQFEWENVWTEAIKEKEFRIRFEAAEFDAADGKKLIRNFAQRLGIKINKNVKKFINEKLKSTALIVPVIKDRASHAQGAKAISIRGEQKTVKNARDAFRQAMEWLIEKRKFVTPIKTRRGTDIIVASKIGMRAPYQLSNGYYFDGNANIKTHLRHAKYVFSCCGLSESDIDFQGF